jgi:hypothetical protein
MRARIGFLVLLGTVVLTGCAATAESSPRVIDGVLPMFRPSADVPYKVVDHLGIVRAVSVVDPGAVQDGITPVPGRDDAVYVVWASGVCDRWVLIRFLRTTHGRGLRVTTGRELGGCALSQPPRVLLIEFSEPIDARTLAFSVDESSTSPEP